MFGTAELTVQVAALTGERDTLTGKGVQQVLDLAEQASAEAARIMTTSIRVKTDAQGAQLAGGPPKSSACASPWPKSSMPVSRPSGPPPSPPPNTNLLEDFYKYGKFIIMVAGRQPYANIKMNLIMSLLQASPVSSELGMAASV